MAQKAENVEKQSLGERGLRFLRDFNLFVGGAALVGAAVVMAPVAAAALTIYGEFNLLQAGGYEVVRQGVKNRQRTRRAIKK